jgi:hypothetical protein
MDTMLPRKTRLTHAAFAFLFGSTLAGIVQHMFGDWFQAGPTQALHIVAGAGFTWLLFLLLNWSEGAVTGKRTA